MSTEAMTPRERWLAVLTHRRPDRTPMDYQATPEFNAALLAYLGENDLRTALKKRHVDFRVSVGPRYVGPALPAGYDVFGCRHADVNYGTGAYDEVVSHPLARYNSAEEIAADYTWPDPDWWDYSGVAAQAVGWEDYPIHGGGSEPFLTYKNLRGEAQAFMDLVEHPDVVHYCLDHLFGLAYAETERIYEQIPGRVLTTHVAEDLGSQQGLMISRRHIHEFLLPRMKRMIDLVHSAGAFVVHHDDGNCRAILPDMIEAGIDVLDPVQWRAKDMDRAGLVADFGERLVFHGAMDNQYTLPFGTVDEVRQEVVDNLRILGAGHFILAPCHNIQPITPVENVLAMYETCYENG